jgi:Dna[CI] antecedent, DciA
VVPVGRVIPGVLAEVIRKAPLCQEKVDFAWAHAVGPALQRVTTVRLDGGVLVVTADREWAREIRRSSSMILQRLARLLGDGTVVTIRTPSLERGTRNP